MPCGQPLPVLPPLPEGEVVRGAGEEEHEGEAGDAGEQVAQREGEEKRGKQGVHLRTCKAWIEQVTLLPEGGG